MLQKSRKNEDFEIMRRQSWKKAMGFISFSDNDNWAITVNDNFEYRAFQKKVKKAPLAFHLTLKSTVSLVNLNFIFRVTGDLVLDVMKMFYLFKKFLNLFKRQPNKMVKQIQTTRWQQATNCLSVFDHIVGLAIKGFVFPR